jgi:hypothetical protein
MPSSWRRIPKPPSPEARPSTARKTAPAAACWFVSPSWKRPRLVRSIRERRPVWPPWSRAPRRQWCPSEMTRPPLLDPTIPTGPVQPRHALLINPFLPEGPQRELRKACAHADACSDQFRRDHATTLAASVLGREPARWASAVCADARGRGDHRPPDLRAAGVRTRAMVSKPRKQGRVRRTARPHADSLAVGDGVRLWRQIPADVEARCLWPQYSATYGTDYREDPAPRRSILPRKSFLPTTSLIATRGGRGVHGGWPALRGLHR